MEEMTSAFGRWVARFETNVADRQRRGDPDWAGGARLTPAVVRSLQRFQTGEEGDGARLAQASAATGDADYATAVRLFIAEEQNHARMLRLLLEAAREPTIDGHWTDTVFVAVRGALGLRMELMTLTVAEVIALRYYRALRDGTDDPLLRDVAARILDDEHHHVAFHVHRLRSDFSTSRPAIRTVARTSWWALLLGTTCVVAVDHGAALRHLGVSRGGFVRDVVSLFRPHIAQVFQR